MGCCKSCGRNINNAKQRECGTCRYRRELETCTKPISVASRAILAEFECCQLCEKHPAKRLWDNSARRTVQNGNDKVVDLYYNLPSMTAVCHKCAGQLTKNRPLRTTQNVWDVIGHIQKWIDRRRKAEEKIASRGSRPLPPEPTSTRPGSKARIKLLRERRAQGYALFHPDDDNSRPVIRDRDVLSTCHKPISEEALAMLLSRKNKVSA